MKKSFFIHTIYSVREDDTKVKFIFLSHSFHYSIQVKTCMKEPVTIRLYYQGIWWRFQCTNFNAFSSHFYYAKFPNALMSIYTPVISTAMMIIFSRLLSFKTLQFIVTPPKTSKPQIFSDRSSKETLIPANSSLHIVYRKIFETSSLCIYYHVISTAVSVTGVYTDRRNHPHSLYYV